MQHFHFNTCPAIPLKVKELYLNLRGNMNNRRGDDKISPKDYWVKCCGDIGIGGWGGLDTVSRDTASHLSLVSG